MTLSYLYHSCPCPRWSPFNEQQQGTRAHPEAVKADELCTRNALALYWLQWSTSVVRADAEIYLKDKWSYMRQIPGMVTFISSLTRQVLVFPSLCLEQASFVSWFLKCSHLINVTGLSVELCEWNIIVWAKKRVEGDELKVYPGLTCKETEPEPNVVCSC